MSFGLSSTLSIVLLSRGEEQPNLVADREARAGGGEDPHDGGADPEHGVPGGPAGPGGLRRDRRGGEGGGTEVRGGSIR